MNVTEFSTRVGLSSHTIRYYDKIGLMGDIQRLPNGHRLFSKKDIKWVEFVQRLKDTGMPLSKIKIYAELRKRGDATLLARKEILIEHSKELTETIAIHQEHLQQLEDKIVFYESELNKK